MLRKPRRRRHPEYLSTYMITGEGDDKTLLERVHRALGAGVDRVQLRLKGAPGRRVEELARALVESLADGGRRLLVNDRLDVALTAGLAGVHLPVDGLPVAEVRRSTPRGFVIGCSAHEIAEAMRAASEGADFIVFGPVFPTRSKPGHVGTGVEALRLVADSVSIPVLALGGIEPSRIHELRDAGVSGVAGISVFEHEEGLAAILRAVKARAP